MCAARIKNFYISAKNTISGLVIYNSYMAQNGAFWTRLRGHRASYARMSYNGITGRCERVSSYYKVRHYDVKIQNKNIGIPIKITYPINLPTK